MNQLVEMSIKMIEILTEMKLAGKISQEEFIQHTEWKYKLIQAELSSLHPMNNNIQHFLKYRKSS